MFFYCDGERIEEKNAFGKLLDEGIRHIIIIKSTHQNGLVGESTECRGLLSYWL